MHLRPLSLRFIAATLLLCAFHVCTLPVGAADPPAKGEDIADLRAASDHAIRQLSKGLSSAFDEIVLARWWKREQADTTATSMQQSIRGMRDNLIKVMGPPIPLGFEPLGTLRYGEHFILFDYLLRHELGYLPAELGFIRLDGKWRLISLSIGKRAEPLARRFVRGVRPADLRFDPVPNGNPIKPADLSDIKHACDATLASMAAGEKSGMFTALMRDHFIIPGTVARETEKLEAEFQLNQAKLVAEHGRLLPVKAELLGMVFLGSNSVSLNYNQPFERGDFLWNFTFYKPAKAWRLHTIKHDHTPVADVHALRTLRRPQEPVPDGERPMFELMARTAAGMAKSSPTALDELLKQNSFARDNQELVAGGIASWTAELPLIEQAAGPSQPTATVSIGSYARGDNIRTLVYMNLRERVYLPISITFLLRDGIWRAANIDLMDNADDKFTPLINYERHTAPAQVAEKLPKAPPSDIAALKQSCDLFMTRATTGKLPGAIEELTRKNKPTGPYVVPRGASEQAQSQMALVKNASSLGKPVNGRFEYLGVGRSEGFLARLVYLQYFEGGPMRWVFNFYRVKNEWRLSHIAYPGTDSFDLDYLQVVEHAQPRGPLK